jgi:hypothetical protein
VVDSDCTSIYHVDVQCVGGKCVPWGFPTLDGPTEEESYQRLYTCVGENTVVDYATIGSTPVCLWGSPNQGLCLDDKTGACPSLAKPTSFGGYTCTGSLSDKWKGNYPLIGPITTTVGIVDNSDDAQGPCDAIRSLRQAKAGSPLTEEAKRNLLASIDFSGMFDRETLSAVAKGLSWEARFGNYSAVILNGKPLFETGQLGGAVPTAWPCGTAELSAAACPSNPLLATCTLDCDKTPTSLLCDHAQNCGEWDQRTPINLRLMNAVWTAQGLTVGHSDRYQSREDGNYGPFTPMIVPSKYTMGNTEPADQVEVSFGGGSRLLTPPVLVDGSGAVKRYSTRITAGGSNYNGTAFTTTSTAAADRDFWADPLNPSGPRLQLTGDLNTFYALENIVPVWARYESNVRKGSFDWNEGADRWHFWANVSRYNEATGTPWFAGAMLNLFSGNGGGMSNYTLNAPLSQGGTPRVDYYAVPNGHGAAYNAQHSDRPPVADRFPQLAQLVGPLDYSDEKLWDAAELLCEVGRASDAWLNTLDTTGECPVAPAKYESEADIPAARATLMCKAELIRRRANNVVLQRLPTLAVKNLLAFNLSRAFPEAGGDMGVAIAKLRETLLRFRNGSLDLQNQVSLIQYNFDRLYRTLKQVEVRKEQAEIGVTIAEKQALSVDVKMEALEFELDKSDWEHMMDFTGSVMGGLSTGAVAGPYGMAVGAAVGAADYVVGEMNDKAGQRAGYQKRILELEKSIANGNIDVARLQIKYEELERAKMLAELEFEIHRGSIAIAIIVNNMRADVEGIDAQLAAIEGLSLEVKRAIGRLTSFESSEAAITPKIRGVMNARLDLSKRRYQSAHERAVKYSFLAKRAIEQRLGMRLSEMRDDLPLVEAPQKWESNLCRSVGIDYAAIKGDNGGRANAAAMAALAENAEPFIGDYVRKLEDVVESYILKYGFKDATDEAIISLRDDIANVRTSCDVESQNLLYHSGQLEPISTPTADGGSVGWSVSGCTPDETGSVAGCFSSTPAEPMNIDGLDGQAKAYELTYASSAATAQLVQSVPLAAGMYRLAWYVEQPNLEAEEPGIQALQVFQSSGAEVEYLYELQHDKLEGAESGWRRQYTAFYVPSPGVYQIAIRKPVGGTTLKVAAAFLEDITVSSRGGDELEALVPSVYQQTTDSRLITRQACKDTGGVAFRQSHWERTCLKLCENGFGADCDNGREECFWQTEFSITQGDIERGLILSQSGFAVGNFNYRVEGVGLNFVGTSLRACETQETPEPCYAAGFVPYSLSHLGPYTVTNHTGRTFNASLFEGTIEHARGLGSERYLTNPLSSGDRELLTPYIRQEFQGRPLDGNYRLRVWDAPGLRFSAIEDVQIYLKYRYWTRTN